MRKKIRNNQGFTLIEALVAISIFTVVAISSTQIFQMVLRSQRQTIYAQNVQENTRFAIETMSKEIRNALVDETGICTQYFEGALIYNTEDTPQEGSDLRFINQYGECVHYFYEKSGNKERLKVARAPIDKDSGLLIEGEKSEAYMTPASISFLEPVFLINNGPEDFQSRVTMVFRFLVDREGRQQEIVNAQTTVSSRYYPSSLNVQPLEEEEFSDCPAGLQTWLSNCQANIGLGLHGSSQSLTNIVENYNGQATYVCNNGLWELQGGSICEVEVEEPPVYDSCSYIASVIWGTSCSGGPVQAVAHGIPQNIINTASGYTGSIRYTCNDGDWVTSNPSCSALASCTGGYKTWGASCGADFPTLASGAYSTKQNVVSGYTGWATYSCNNGSWVYEDSECSPKPCVRHDATAPRLNLPCTYWTKEGFGYYIDSSCSAIIDPFHNEDYYCGCASGYCLKDIGGFYSCGLISESWWPCL